MNTKVKIYGAGSIGNHLAHACRGHGWDVLICDVDGAALDRTRDEIYPSRYGAWDTGIRLAPVAEAADEPADLVIVGTPPDTHMELAMREMEATPPRVLLMEKPLCGPDLADCEALRRAAAEHNVQVLVGYNHVLARNTDVAGAILAAEDFGPPDTLTVNWVEHWGGIFGAHPWLAGPADSYLGYARRGGGACGEHSHGINIWQHFSRVLDTGRIVEVFCTMDKVTKDGVDYDRIAQLSVRTETGLTGYIIQDVVTQPPVKGLRIQFNGAALEWYANWDSGHDAVRVWSTDAGWRDELIAKTRPDDFAGEINHVAQLLNGDTTTSPISLDCGLDTMMVIAAAHKSAAEGRMVAIDYARGYEKTALI